MYLLACANSKTPVSLHIYVVFPFYFYLAYELLRNPNCVTEKNLLSLHTVFIWL